MSKEFNAVRRKNNNIVEFYTVESLAKKLPKMKITQSTYYLSKIGAKLYVVLQKIGELVNKTHMALILSPINPAPGGFLHKLLFPLLVKIGATESNNQDISLGVAIKAVKK